MRCPRCESIRVNKNGRKKDKQNYICVDCKKQFIDTYDRRGYSQEIKEECLSMYADGMGFRAIERIKGVHHTTIISWVEQIKAPSLESEKIRTTLEKEELDRSKILPQK